ncbi:hypothetical protein EEDFHM_03136 [Methylorubrum populi]
MIRPAQFKLLERARIAVASDPTEFAGLLRRYGGADCIEALTAQGFDRLMDHMTVTGFKCRQRPTLSAATHKQVEETARRIGLSPYAYTADLRGYGGVSDLRDLSGRGLIELLMCWQPRGLDVAEFVAARRTVTPAQLRLIQLARKRIEMPDNRYYGMLLDYGGVASASDLDGRGVNLCLAFMEAEGFDRDPPASTQPAFGRRTGFASPEQVELIRTLWREWSGPTGEAEDAVEASLNAWLERYHRVSSLRFLTTGGAGKVITALRTMKVRKSDRPAEIRHA